MLKFSGIWWIFLPHFIPQITNSHLETLFMEKIEEKKIVQSLKTEKIFSDLSTAKTFMAEN